MKILVIPAIPNTPLRQRAAELARALGARHQVVLLFGERQPPGLGLAAKLWWHARQALTCAARPLAPNVIGLRLPSVPRWPAFSRRYQTGLAALLARAWGVHAVVTQGIGEVRAPRPRGGCIIYDLLDNHMAGLELEGKREGVRALRQFIKGEIQRASAATASSRVLVRVLEQEFGAAAALVPNGVAVEAYRQVPREVTDGLRRRLRLGAGPVLGFTGGVDWWVDTRLALAALAAVRRDRPDAQLLIVGDGSRAPELRAAGLGVVVTGFVPPGDVPAYVALFDVGLVPFVKNALTDAMLPIKVFDYGAARKPAVSTPLEAYAGEGLPFLRVAGGGPAPFAAAVLEALQGGWDPTWDGAVDRYDWARVVEPLEGLLALRRACQGH